MSDDPFALTPEQQAYRDRHQALFDDGARLAFLGEPRASASRQLSARIPSVPA